MKLGGEATEAGVLLDTAGLLPGAAACPSVAGRRWHDHVTDGPFTESKELISYALYEVRSKEEAIEGFPVCEGAPWDLWPGLGGTHRRPAGDGGQATVADYQVELHAAIEAVWRIESPRLIAALARITGGRARAEELAQTPW